MKTPRFFSAYHTAKADLYGVNLRPTKSLQVHECVCVKRVSSLIVSREYVGGY